MTLSKKLLFALIVLLPLNLGKHFEVVDSYVWGILSDYLVPAIYVQDLLAVGVLFFWLKEKGFPQRSYLLRILNHREIQAIIFLLFSLGLSVLASERFIPSLFIILRVVLYAGVSLYVAFEFEPEKDFTRVVKLLSLSIIFLSLLSIMQFWKQGSVFDNYLFFGEQPYSVSTWGIDKEYVFGKVVVPSYGLFRHPNIFGGFTSLLLVWFLPFLKKNVLARVAFIGGLISLSLTFSVVAWVGLLLGVTSYLYLRNLGPSSGRKTMAVFAFVSVFVLTNILVPQFSGFKHPSFFRRADLSNVSFKTVQQNVLFGVGPGNFVSALGDMTFSQPVHNIFLLILSESGLFSLVFFVSLLYFAIKRSVNPSYFFIFLVSLLQIVFIGSLDHYFWTIHQTLLLMWLVVGLSFSGRFS